LSKSNLGLFGIIAMIVSNPILFFVLAGIFVGLFAVSYATLVLWNMVSALIYGGIGLLVVFLAGRNILEKHFWLIFIPIAGFGFGWFSDNRGIFGLSLVPMINQNVVIAQNAVVSGQATTIFGSLFVAMIGLIVAVLALGFVHFIRKK
jgi:hypothetical protein